MADSWFEVERLSKERASELVEPLVALLNRIPLVDHGPNDVLMETKDGMALVAKWEQSLVATAEGRPVGLLLTHVRPAGPLFTDPTFYVAGLAVAEDCERRGVGGVLVSSWLKNTMESHYMTTGNVTRHSLQTNSAAFNQPVRRFYESFGFVVEGTKEYDNRTDIVMFR